MDVGVIVGVGVCVVVGVGVGVSDGVGVGVWLGVIVGVGVSVGVGVGVWLGVGVGVCVVVGVSISVDVGVGVGVAVISGGAWGNWMERKGLKVGWGLKDGSDGKFLKEGKLGREILWIISAMFGKFGIEKLNASTGLGKFRKVISPNKHPIKKYPTLNFIFIKKPLLKR